VLCLENLSLSIPGGGLAVRALSLSVPAARTLALIGESGCGKSLTAQAILRLLPPGIRWAEGRIHLEGLALETLTEAQMRQVRGRRIGMIFQEPTLCLNPVLRVSTQLEEVFALHRGLSGRAAQGAMQALLEHVGVDRPLDRLLAYPFELSGGLKQRIMLALALAANPKWLIADEPTTALDVSVQAQVLEQLRALQATHQMGLLLITHDLGVVAQLAHEVGVMYAGELIETASASVFFKQPAHPYTQALMAALPGQTQGRLLALPGRVARPDEALLGCRFAPRCPQAQQICHEVPPPWIAKEGTKVRCHGWALTGFWAPSFQKTPNPPVSIPAKQPPSPKEAIPPSTPLDPLLEVDGLHVQFPIRSGFFRRVKGAFHALEGIDIRLYPGKTLALVGESGSGKSTLARALLQLIPYTARAFRLSGSSPCFKRPSELKTFRQHVQMVFQDPHASLNGRLTVQTLLSEGMQALGVEPNPDARQKRVHALLEEVGLDPLMALRYPHAFSGGQRQRLAIARALAVNPRVLICDEPTSALDVSVQAQILSLLKNIQKKQGLAYLFITHNMAVVREMADELAVLYQGRIVEQGPASHILTMPQHPYTQLLLSCIPRLSPIHEEAAPSAHLTGPSDALAAQSNPSGKHRIGQTQNRWEAACAFEPLCPHAQPSCLKQTPELLPSVSGTRVRCPIAV
jgi:peptide/nickel transport system ATP-binding protein